ncbi:MAG: helix-turn-helix domain-containing protein [Rhodospirillum sp.]|nr:helix-turn-helix domain-containing protein [Rhodospirillum sp.]MCF8488417.1 helix-turn-helix domain-containing protein [Rhodospirillum sp.]MCF8501761.1 helix-turn-helix domain-containing protein [Rhodospirillum sp.]
MDPPSTDWRAGARPTDFMQGFAKGLAVIEAFDDGEPRLSVADVALRTGLDRATARRCLLTLSTLGYADYDGKFFRLSPRTLRLGQAYSRSASLPAIVQPHLDSLSEETGESASVSILDGPEVVYVARASRKRVMAINLTPGSRLPAYCASMGRVLLASLPPALIKAILTARDRPAHTPRTKTALDDLMDTLARVAAQGYAAIDQELELGLCSLAVPLCNDKGIVVAALNIGAHSMRLSIEQMVERFLPLLLKSQAQLRPVLGNEKSTQDQSPMYALEDRSNGQG